MNLPSFLQRAKVTPQQWLAFFALTFVTIFLLWLGWRWAQSRRPPALLTHTTTLAGAGPQITHEELADPFGIVTDSDGNAFITDGLGGRVYKLAAADKLTIVAENLDMPSALALAADGSLIVANTGAHTIIRISTAGQTELIAGAPGQSGFADGAAGQARFNAPVGVAMRADGAVLVADTYNDRVRVIGIDGQVKTLAEGFDTPCGLAVAGDGAIYVADTGNHRISRIAPDGSVAVLAGAGDDGLRDGELLQAAFA